MEHLDVIIDALAHIAATPRLEESLISYNNQDNGFYVETYFSSNETDKNYIGSARKDIWNFFNDGYVAAGLGRFVGCYNDKSVKKNTIMLRQARKTEGHDIIAMSIYTGYPSGTKCVGLTIKVTHDEQERALAKKALKYIVKQDISKFKEYYWIECDGPIKYYWQRYGGIKIPNSYLPSILNSEQLESVRFIDGEEYDYIRIIGKNTDEEIEARKCIFGFPNREILDDYIKRHQKSIEELEDEVNRLTSINESASIEKTPEVVELYIKFTLRYFVDLIEDGRLFTYSEKVLSVAGSILETLSYWYKKYKDVVDGHTRFDLECCIQNLEMLAKCYTVLKPYTLDDYLETAESDAVNNRVMRNDYVTLDRLSL